ncbi:39S ribosomal protein L53/MRP-L53-domain-containing protein [Cladorrhinum sp. PSN259]|nr:39S ribosomal protein L53/MRP-L53-domain-containing protein [Cladorrhinum sp. PSN259]
MITSFITQVSTKFNPFSAASKPARLFLAFLPPNARSSGGMTIQTQLLPRNSTEKPTLYVKFKDGKEMNLDPSALGIKSIVEEVDRHSRILQKAADLANA